MWFAKFTIHYFSICLYWAGIEIKPLNIINRAPIVAIKFKCSPKNIKHKLSSYLHHIEYDENPLDVDTIENIIKNKKAIYDLNLDKKLNKLGEGNKLEIYDINKLPTYIQQNEKKLEKWLN